MRKIVVATALGAVALAGGATAYLASTGSSDDRATAAQVQLAADQHHAPAPLKAPAGTKRIAEFHGDGVQIYGCTNGSWTFVQPSATLSANGTPVAVHFAGPAVPRWESTKDGSLVGAKKIASVDQKGSIPQLLLQATENTGGAHSQFGAVTFVQRLNTQGGAAPAGACTAGAQVGVHYSADYVFWVSAK